MTAVNEDSVDHAAIQKKELNLAARGELPRLFAVVTWGCTASAWLAKALNSFPEVFAVHHPRHFISLLSPDIQKVRQTDLLSVVRLLGAGNKLAGAVHGISRFSIPELTSSFGDQFCAAGVVRDPLPRLQSQFALFESHAFDTTNYGDLSYVKRLPGYEHITSLVGNSIERVSFVHSANMLNAVIEEVRLLPKIFRMEDLTTKPDTLLELLSALSAGMMSFPREIAELVIQLPRNNRHRAGNEGVRLEGWQREVILAIVQLEAWRHYIDLGYEPPEFVRDI